MIETFRTHTGQTFDGYLLKLALIKVASDWRKLALDIRLENAYASHVTDAEKAADMNDMLNEANRIEAGRVDSFTIWQRVNTVLTGECVPFLKR